MKCPVCGNRFTVSDYLYEAPYIGKLLLSSGICGNCGYKWSDVRLAESRGPRRITYTVEKPDDLNALVIRSSSAKLMIPELGVEITPGYIAQGYITTVEGIIIDVYEKAEFICKNSNTASNNCRKKLEELKKALNASIRFTVVIEDPIGVSTIVSSRAKEEPLERSEKDY